jgi:hypothetical protein
MKANLIVYFGVVPALRPPINLRHEFHKMVYSEHMPSSTYAELSGSFFEELQTPGDLSSRK